MPAIVYYARKILGEITDYHNLPAGERPVFWRKMEALLFLALMPFFLVLGMLSRLSGKRRRKNAAGMADG